MNTKLSIEETAEERLSQTLKAHRKDCALGSRCIDCATENDQQTRRVLVTAMVQREFHEGWIRSTDGAVCTYCGADSTEAIGDHLVPQPWTGDAVRRVVPTVPCCLDCNVRLGVLVQPVVRERCTHIAASLRRKHAKTLKVPERSAEWFDEFGYKMRKTMLAKQALRQEIRRRLVVLDQGGALEAPQSLYQTPFGS